MSRMFFCGDSQKLILETSLTSKELEDKEFIEDLHVCVEITKDNIFNNLDLEDKLCNLRDAGQISDKLYIFLLFNQDILEKRIVELYPYFLATNSDLRYDIPLYNNDAIYLNAIVYSFVDKIYLDDKDNCLCLKGDDE